MKPSSISNKTALRLLRAGLKENRPATEMDWARVADILGGSNRTPPVGAFSHAQYMQKFGLSNAQARHRLDAYLTKGMLDSGLFNSPVTNKMVRYYWLKPEAKK
jgi:hypothetical protein